LFEDFRHGLARNRITHILQADFHAFGVIPAEFLARLVVSAAAQQGLHQGARSLS
jgi:hypothetical protein